PWAITARNLASLLDLHDGDPDGHSTCFLLIGPVSVDYFLARNRPIERVVRDTLRSRRGWTPPAAGPSELRRPPMNTALPRTMGPALGWAVSLMLAMLVAGPAHASGWDVAFYELTENMTFDGTTRTGSGALAGEAKVGTPLCPDALMNALV